MVFSGRVTLARMDLSTGVITEEEVDVSDLWEIRVYRKNLRAPLGGEEYVRIHQSDGGIIEAKAQPSPRPLAVYPRSPDTVAIKSGGRSL